MFQEGTCTYAPYVGRRTRTIRRRRGLLLVGAAPMLNPPAPAAAEKLEAAGAVGAPPNGAGAVPAAGGLPNAKVGVGAFVPLPPKLGALPKAGGAVADPLNPFGAAPAPNPPGAGALPNPVVVLPVAPKPVVLPKGAGAWLPPNEGADVPPNGAGA